jgi:hypothetical protein
VQEPLLSDPAAFFDEFALHDRNLAGGAAERLQRDGEPGAYRVAERDDVTHRPRGGDAPGIGLRGLVGGHAGSFPNRSWRRKYS